MASNTILRANISPLKRSFDHFTISAELTACCDTTQKREQYAERRSLSVSANSIDQPSHRHTKRRNQSTSAVSSMFAQGTTIMSGSFPSFMSVYGNEDPNIYNHVLSEHGTKAQQLGLSQFPTNSTQTSLESEPRLVERRGSLTSTTSFSTESSPTTTSSTFDSPIMANLSPDSSPESASSAMPPKSFQRPAMVSAGTQTLDFPQEGQHYFRLKPKPAPVPDQAVDEQKKNLKKLTIDMKLPSLTPTGTGSGSDSQPFSTPSSPFKEPLRTGRRKPNNLTIRTPGFNQLSFGANALAIPPTPNQKPVLHHAQSSPSLPTLMSPTKGPAGGMRLTLPSGAQHVKRDSLGSITGFMAAPNLPSLREEPYQPPKSQEAPERGYTNGPCLVYDNGVYLYLEPTAEEAAEFDSVINVAKEIKNPFENSSNEGNTVMSVWRSVGSRQSIIEPQTAMSERSFKSAFEWPSAGSPATPTTPRPTSGSQLKKPEYLHVQWDHNSEILEDLLPLCRHIDDRVQQGKKVLVHCQLGVSRSASLIIAYGLYKGYEKDFHSMYMAVKRRSQWVGPNMSLIYQLTDFKSKCDKGLYANSHPQLKPEWIIYGIDGGRTPIARPQSEEKSGVHVQSELNLESKTTLRLNKELPPVPPFPSEPVQTLKRIPSEFKDKSKTIKKAMPRALPFREMGYTNDQMSIPPHRPRIVPGLTFAQPSMDLAMQDVPAAPSLFSPRTTEFMMAPFGVTTAGDLVTSTPKTVKPPPGAFPGGKEWRNSIFLGQDVQSQIMPTIATVVAPPPKPPKFDPRSPHQNGDSRDIFGSIDHVL